MGSKTLARSRGGLTRAENHVEERIGKRRRITFLLNEPTTPVSSPLSDAPMDVDPVESNIEAQVKERRGEKRRRDETPGDEEVPEPRSSKIAKGVGEQKRLGRCRGMDNES